MSSTERFNSIDVFHTDNRVVGARGTSIDFINPRNNNDDGCGSSSVVVGFTTKYQKSQKPFAANKILLTDAGNSLFAMTSDKKNLLCQFDTNTGTNIQELEFKLFHSAVNGPLDVVVPFQKFSSTKPTLSDCSLVGVSGNTLMKIHWDLRQPVKNYVIKKEQAFTKASRGFKFTCVATTRAGDIVTGATDGSIRFFKNATALKMAKTTLNKFADPVTGLDVTADGEWVVWTTESYLAVFNTSWTDNRGGTHSAFSESMPAQHKRIMTLKIPPKYLKNHSITKVSLTPAKFDNGPQCGVQNIIEQEIVTSTGPFIIRFKMRLVKTDYLAEECIQNRSNPTIYRQQDKIYDKTFGYGNNYLFTAFRSDVKSINLDEQEDEEDDEEEDDDDKENERAEREGVEREEKEKEKEKEEKEEKEKEEEEEEEEKEEDEEEEQDDDYRPTNEEIPSNTTFTTTTTTPTECYVQHQQQQPTQSKQEVEAEPSPLPPPQDQSEQQLLQLQHLSLSDNRTEDFNER